MSAANIKNADRPGPAQYGAAVTPSDVPGSGDLAQVANSLYVGVGGDVNIIDALDNDLLFKNAAAGSIIPCSVKRVGAGTTTATNLIALYL